MSDPLPSGKSFEGRLSRAAAAAGAGVAVLGTLAVVGRVTGAGLLASPVPGAPAMLLWVAVTLAALGLGLLALARAPRPQGARSAAIVVALGALALASLSLLGHLTGWPIGPERLERFLPLAPAAGFDLRPAHPLVGVSLVSASGALLAVAVGRRRWAAGPLGVFTLVAGFVVCLGFLYRAPLFGGVVLRPVALPAGLALALLGTGLVAAAGRDVWPLRDLAGSSVRAQLSRWFLPFVVFAVLLSDLVTTDLLSGLSPALMSVLGALATVAAAAAATWYLARAIGGRLDRAEQEMQRRGRLYDVLSQTNQLIVRVDDEQTLYERACRIAVERGQLDMAWVGVVDADTHLVRVVASHGNVGTYLDDLRISVDDVPAGRGPTGSALREGRPFICRDIETESYMAPWREKALAMGFRASAAFPLTTLGAVTGVYSIYAREPGWFTDEQVKLLQELTGDISYALGALAKERRRMRAEEQLAASETRFRALIDHSSDLITIIDPDGTIRYESPSVTRLLGYEPAERVGHNVFELMHPGDVGRAQGVLRAAVAGGARRDVVVCRLRHKDGSWCVVETAGSSLLGVPGVQGIVLNSRDVTDRDRLESQLRQAQKMEAVGQLAGGIAHDFNNLLTVVLANADLVAMALPERHDVAEELRDLQVAARRGQAMVRNLMGFSRQRGVESEPVQLGALVGQMTDTLRRVLPETVEIRCSTEPELPTVLADPGAVEQMLLNLATNARDAMASGGVLQIGVAREVVPELLSEELTWLRPGRYVTVTVSDTGTGMDEETRLRVFEPFFTTKPAGKGTGLGMPMVYGLMKQHGGHVVVSSTLGRGSTVRLLFPEADVPVVGEAAEEHGVMAPLAGGETVLVVEDEEALRRAARRILELQGYRVLVAADGQEALNILAERQGRVDLVFTDLIMPRLGGRVLYERVQAEFGPVRFLVASGYAGREVREDHGLPAAVPFVNKPWTLEELVVRVRDAIQAPPAAPGPA